MRCYQQRQLSWPCSKIQDTVRASFYTFSAIGLGLQVEQFGIQPTTRGKLRMTSDLDDLALRQDYDQVSHLNRREAMRDLSLIHI